VPTAWVVSPIGANGVVSGVLALQVPIATVNDVMTGDEDWARDGLGETGETYLAGPDLLMHSVSRLVLEDPEAYTRAAISGGAAPDVAERAARVRGTVLIQPVQTEAVQRALRGETGEIVSRDYLGQEALVAYAPLKFEGLQWVIVAKIDAAEAFAPVNDFTRDLILATVAIARCRRGRQHRRVAAQTSSIEGGAWSAATSLWSGHASFAATKHIPILRVWRVVFREPRR